MTEHTLLGRGDQQQFMNHRYPQHREEDLEHHADRPGLHPGTSEGAEAGFVASGVWEPLVLGEDVISSLSITAGWLELKPAAQGVAGRHLFPLTRKVFGGALSGGSKQGGELL